MNFVPLAVKSPDHIDAHMRALLREIGLNPADAFLLPYTHPVAFEPEPGNCHFNVWLKMKINGGWKQSGWILGQDKQHQFSEAQFHTVWLSEDDGVLDITPRKDEEELIFFIPDDERDIELSSHEGRPAIITYDNVRLIGNVLHTPLKRQKRVLDTDFPVRHGLWPW